MFPFSARAEDACTQKIRTALLKPPGSHPDLYPYGRDNLFDLEARAQEALDLASLKESDTLYSCRLPEGPPLCIQSSQGKWFVRDHIPVEYSAQVESRLLRIERTTTHRSGGDPWYGIGAKTWEETTKIQLDLESLRVKHLFIDGLNSTLGISKRTRREGQCTPTKTASLKQVLIRTLRETLFADLRGKPGSRGGTSASGAQYVRIPNEGILQITDLNPQEGKVQILHLASGVKSWTRVEDLRFFPPLRLGEIHDEIRETGASPGKSLYVLEGETGETRLWSCVQATTALLNPSQEVRDIDYRGYSVIEIRSSKRGLGADLGYRPLARASLKKAGWLGHYRPARLPFDQESASIVQLPSGETQLIVSGPKGPRTSTLRMMRAEEAGPRYGIDSDLLVMGDLLCL